MALKLPRLPSGFKIINRDGSPTDTFQLWWNNVAGQLELNINAITAALEAADIAIAAAESAQASADAADAAAAAAQTAADDATAATQQTAAEASIVNSGIINPLPVYMIRAFTSGNVTLSDHDRRYGDPTLNPTVAVDGDTVSTGQPAGEVIYVFYDDPTRAGGAVTYQWSLDPSDTIQGGNRHAIGSVTIPAAGTEDGTFVRPPGVT
jgi:hypothetical protein